MSTVRPSTRNALGLRSDETVGVAIAAVAHVGIIAALAINALRAPAVIPPPERVVVSLSEDVGLDSAAPQVAEDAKASVADTIGEIPLPPKPQVQKPAPPKPVPEPPKPKPVPKPVAKPEPKKPVVSPRTSSVTPKPPVAKPTPKPKPTGGSRLGDNFLEGKGASVDANAPVPASQVGASDKASIQQALSRQLARYWQPPSGAEAEDLVTILAFDLNPDGSLAGDPRVVSQSGVTDSNKAQAGRHAELAIRAVRRAAPFDLPPKFYNVWKRIRTSRFDWELAQ